MHICLVAKATTATSHTLIYGWIRGVYFYGGITGTPTTYLYRFGWIMGVFRRVYNGCTSYTPAFLPGTPEVGPILDGYGCIMGVLFMGV